MPFDTREPRTKQVAFAVSEDEKTLIVEWARDLGISVSEFMRDASGFYIEFMAQSQQKANTR